MANSADFKSFLKDINPNETTIKEASRLHRNLRDHLKESDAFAGVCLDTYLSGSYAKHTFIRPKTNSAACDIDIVVETSFSTADDPNAVLSELESAILERECYQNVRIQTHSVGIDMASFHLDVVPLVKDEDGLLYIGSSDDGGWMLANPKEHKAWSTEVNQGFGGNYKSLVKIMKWWRRENCPSWVKFPKGITLEKMIADNLPESDLSIEEQIMQVMANLSEAYSEELESYRVPVIEDPVLDGNDLAAEYCYDDFSQFVNNLNEHLALLADEGTGNSTWKTILGDEFPSGNSSSSFASSAKFASQTKALSVKHRQELPYPMQARKPNATIAATVTLPTGKSYELENDGQAIPKGSDIVYRVNSGPIKDGFVKWQVTNTGDEAMEVCRRGGFEGPNEGRTSRRESTAYVGKHYVQCFIIRKGACVRWSKPFFINVE